MRPKEYSIKFNQDLLIPVLLFTKESIQTKNYKFRSQDVHQKDHLENLIFREFRKKFVTRIVKILPWFFIVLRYTKPSFPFFPNQSLLRKFRCGLNSKEKIVRTNLISSSKWNTLILFQDKDQHSKKCF